MEPRAQSRWPQSQHLSDGGTTSGGGRSHRTARGLTVLEMIASMAVLGIMLSIAVPRARPGQFALLNAHTQLLADLRITRADALTKGDHFRLELTGSGSYQEIRLQLVGTDWVPFATVRDRTLPDGITLSSTGTDQFEFDTRGLLIDSAGATLLELQDQSGHTRRVMVWPSGQVASL